MNNVPQKIYLQIGDKCDADDFNELSTEDITWAADKIFKNDFEYVLASDKDKESAIKEFDRSVNALALELHESVWNDVHYKWNQVKNSIK